MTKANIFVLIKMSSQDEGKRRLRDVFKTSSSRRMFAGIVRWIIMNERMNVNLLLKPKLKEIRVQYLHQMVSDKCSNVFVIISILEKLYWNMEQLIVNIFCRMLILSHAIEKQLELISRNLKSKQNKK